MLQVRLKRRVEPPSAAAGENYFNSSKRLMMTPLHRQFIAPMSFFDEAIGDSGNFLKQNEVGKPFGLHNEAYIRKCYQEIAEEIQKDLAAWINPQVENGILLACPPRGNPRFIRHRQISFLGVLACASHPSRRIE